MTTKSTKNAEPDGKLPQLPLFAAAEAAAAQPPEDRFKSLRPETDVCTLDLELDEIFKDCREAKWQDKQLCERKDALQNIIFRRKSYAKSFAAEQEKNNKQYLIFVTSGKNLHKVIDNSALFFHLDIAKKINEGSNLYSDKDTYSRSAPGTVTKCITPEFISRLEQINVFPTDEIKYDGPSSDVICFKIPYEYSDEQIKDFAEQAVAANSKFNADMMPKNPYPNLYDTITESSDACMDLIGHLRSYSELTKIGEDVFESIRQMSGAYLDMASGRTEKKPAFLEIKHRIISIKNDLKFIESSTKFREKSALYLLGDKIVSAEVITRRLLQSQENQEK